MYGNGGCGDDRKQLLLLMTDSCHLVTFSKECSHQISIKNDIKNLNIFLLFKNKNTHKNEKPNDLFCGHFNIQSNNIDKNKIDEENQKKKLAFSDVEKKVFGSIE